MNRFCTYLLSMAVTLGGCQNLSTSAVAGKLERRIVGGQEASESDGLGFAVFIASWRSQCTGALIAPDWILSAAHCFHIDGYTSDFNFTAGDFNIRSENAQTRRSYWVRKHPDFRRGLSKHDIAIAQTEVPFELSPTLKVLELWDKEWPQDRPDYVECTAYGWGRQRDTEGSQPHHLQVLKVTAAHGERSCPCAMRFQAKRLVCSGGIESKGLCMGDSGSALVCNGKAVGVAHVNMDKRACSFFDVPDLHCGDKHTFSYFMYLCPYLDWMRNYVHSVPYKPASCRASHLLPFLFALLPTLFLMFTQCDGTVK